MQKLKIAAQETSLANQLSPVELRDIVLDTLLPVIDIFAQMQHEESVPGRST